MGPQVTITPDLSPAAAAVSAAVPSSVAFRLAKGEELIPGYVLGERIRDGANGEVWSATAPGGLTKAIKLIYGRMEETRALQELKSLCHVKELRHPFLLTLERIEVVDDHLVIVTEIADSNLMARFTECRNSGLPGIPREEILEYVREAADALDYLAESHSLQHLDVKPENLLLVGRHIKVGDFGLLKQLRESSDSRVHGLTPCYASPEVFDGRPGRRSDQYSLAIVYQEMATGRLPFDGRSAAALASQHMQSPPGLWGLTPQERFAVGKALSKVPDRRFASCREFAARLAGRNPATMFTAGRNTPGTAGNGDASPPNNEPRCRNGNRPVPGGPAPASIHDVQTISLDNAATTRLPALSLDVTNLTYRPTVFIGIGGTGGKVVCRLRQLLTDCFGNVASCPALRFLWINTDVAALSDASLKSSDDSLREEETLAAPLKPTWHYRNTPLGCLASLSRRWVYNIPRSLRTEGIRSLGRMALLDHAAELVESLRRAFSAAVNSEAVSLTAKHTGMAFAETDPRVFLVTSISGGTGGGMVLDTAYAVRQVLAESGLSDDYLCGILTYSTPSGEKSHGLAAASAYACLQEMHYFSVPGNEYPGEPACQLAGFPESGPPLKNTYLVNVGDNLTEEQWAKEVDRLAAYLLLNSVTPASAFFDECRKREREQCRVPEMRLRTLGLAPLGPDTSAIPSPWIETLCKSVVQTWQGRMDTTDAADPIRLSDYTRLFEAHVDTVPRVGRVEKAAVERLADEHFDQASLAERLRGRLAESLACAVESYLKRIVTECLASGSSAESPVGSVIGKLHAVAGIKEYSEPSLADRLQSLRELSNVHASGLGKEIGESLRGRILERVEDRESRVAGARRMTDWMAARLESLEAVLRENAADAQSRRADYLAMLFQSSSNTRGNRRTHADAVAEHLQNYAALVLRELLFEAMLRTVRTVRPLMTACSDRLRELWKDLNGLGEAFAVTKLAGGAAGIPAVSDDRPTRFFDPLAKVFRAHGQEMIEQIDEEMETKFFSTRGRLREVLSEGPSARGELVARMRAAARTAFLRCAKHAAVSRLRDGLTDGDDQELSIALQECCDAAAPKLPDLNGGAKRLVLAIPKDLDASR